jgi:PAS domain S-box-containing protein
MKLDECCLSKQTLLTVLCFLLMLASSAGAQLRQTRRVLVINDLGIVSSPGFAEVDQAIFSVLQNSPYQIELYHESLQLIFFPDDASQRAFRESLIRKYSERKPDLIIAAGSASLKFIAESHEPFIREAPVIFCAVVGQIPNQLKSGLHVTGVLGRLQPEETLKAALHLLPGTKRVVVVGGMGKFDEQWEEVAKQAFQKHESKLEFSYFTDLTMPVLLERLRHLPSNTIVFHTSISEDAAAQRFIDSAQSVPLVAAAANAPVFVMDDVDLRAGTVGGALINWPDDGRVAGEMAVRVLNGERPDDIPIEMSKNVYMFDWRALKRWGLKESDLPAGSIVLNRERNFWESHKSYVISAFLVVLAQALALFALLWQRARKRKVEKELKKSEEKFSKAFQRSPLAFTLASLVDYRFVEVNDTFERYTGWKRDEVVGRTPLEIKFWVNISQRSTFLAQLRAKGAVRDLEVQFRTKDGYLRTGLVSSEVIDLNGEPCALSLIADVTNAKTAEKARDASEQRLRLAQQVAQIGTFEWNIGTGLNTWTQELEAMYGLPTGGFSGTQTAWEDLLHPDDRVTVIELVNQSLKTGTPMQAEWRIVWPDGSVHWIAGRWRVLMNESGEPSRMVGVNLDVTDRKRAEEALLAVNRRLVAAEENERARIGRELHDDINQRLALLAIELDQLQERPSEVAGRLRELRKEIDEISSDVQSLSHDLHSSKLEYLGVVAGIKSWCKDFAERQMIEIRFSSNVSSLLPFEVGRTLFRILQEAVHNAMKHSGVKGIEVQLLQKSNELHLIVSDSGRGFDVEQAFQSNGLGLTSMRERVRLVNGTIAIESKPMHGTTIHIRVPLGTETFSERIAG